MCTRKRWNTVLQCLYTVCYKIIQNNERCMVIWKCFYINVWHLYSRHTGNCVGPPSSVKSLLSIGSLQYPGIWCEWSDERELGCEMFLRTSDQSAVLVPVLGLDQMKTKLCCGGQSHCCVLWIFFHVPRHWGFPTACQWSKASLQHNTRHSQFSLHNLHTLCDNILLIWHLFKSTSVVVGGGNLSCSDSSSESHIFYMYSKKPLE